MHNFDYGAILLFFVFSTFLSAIIVGASYFFSVKNPDPEKIGIYECGFSPYSDSRHPFEIRFFLVAILFIIFDLEISFLFPWSVTIFYLDHFAYWTMMIFLFILTMGLLYEWNKGGLEWE